MSDPQRNTNVPTVPQPSDNPGNLAACVMALKAGMESLAGMRGKPSDRAVTFNDLVDFGVLTHSAVQSPTGTFVSTNISGMVAGQIPIAASPASITSSVARLTASFMPAYTGDVTSPAGSTVNTLPAVNTNVGTWNNITINAKGLATAGSNVAYLTGNQTITLSGDVSGSGTTAIPTTLATVITAKGGTNKTSWVVGSIPFLASATAFGENNTNLFWDNANKFIGIGTATPGGKIHVAGVAANLMNVLAVSGTTTAQVFSQWANTSGNLIMGIEGSAGNAITTGGLPYSTVFGTQNAQSLHLATNDIPRLTIDSAGGVTLGSPTGGSKGLGTLNATGLYVNNVAVAAGSFIPSSGGPFTGTLTYGGPAGTTQAVLNAGGSTTGGLYSQWTNTSGNMLFGIESSTGGSIIGGGTAYSTVFGSQAAQNVHLFSNNQARTTLDSTGGFQIGTPAGGSKGAGTLNATTVYAAGVALSSDINLKHELTPLPPCLELVSAVEPKGFRWILPMDPVGKSTDGEDLYIEDFTPPGHFERVNWGFIAQDFVGTSISRDNGTAVDLGGLVAVLWQAVRELSTRLEALEHA